MGEPFSFERHEYLREPYSDDHPNMIFRKAGQLGLSTYAILNCLYLAIYKNLIGILYLFPTDKAVGRFCRAKIDPLIASNPDSIGRFITDNDSISMKTIKRCILHLGGMQTGMAVKEMTVDFIVFDELDEAPEDKIELAEERMGHSKINRVLKLSNPTMPDFGIDKDFQLSDERHWLIKCPKCGGYTDLVETFPDCLLKLPNGQAIRACQNVSKTGEGKCHAELDPSNGEWVAKRPGITDCRGYQFSQLFGQSPAVSPDRMLKKWQQTTNLPVFYNMKVGIPFVEAENRLSKEEVLALCGDGGIVSYETAPCSMGVDQGKNLHVVIGKRHWQKQGQIVHVGVYRDWEELDALMKNFHVSRCVVDREPETRKAREFANRFPGKVFLHKYNSFQKSSYSWDDENYEVRTNRTESLDASHYSILRGEMVLPKKCQIIDIFAEHMHNIGKRLVEDKNGTSVYVYKRLGEDHFRHSYNYYVIALQHGIDSFFAGCDLS